MSNPFATLAEVVVEAKKASPKVPNPGKPKGLTITVEKDAPSADAGSAELSESQKKRRARKAAKAKATAETPVVKDIGPKQAKPAGPQKAAAGKAPRPDKGPGPANNFRDPSFLKDIAALIAQTVATTLAADRAARADAAGPSAPEEPAAAAAEPAPAAPTAPAAVETPALPVKEEAPRKPTGTPGDILDGHLKNFVAKVPSSMLEKVKSLLEVQAIAAPTGAAGVNPHEVLAVARRMATMWVLAYLVRRGHRVIDSFYGSNRDIGICSELNAVLRSAGWGSEEEPFLTVNVHGDIVVADDIRRRREASPVKADAAFSMDVYCLPEASSKINPEHFASYGYADFIWVGHAFNDLWGSVDTAFWYRKLNNSGRDMIHWASDRSAEPYPPHEPCEAMHHGGGNATHVWSVVKSWNIATPALVESDPGGHTKLYDALWITQRAVELVEVPVMLQPSTQGVFETQIPDREKLKATCKWLWTDTLLDFYIANAKKEWIPTIKVVVNRHHVMLARNYVLGRAKNKYTVGGLKTFIDQLCTKDKVFSFLERENPTYFESYREDLFFAAITRNADRDSSRMRDLRAVHSVSFSDYNEARNSVATPEPEEGSRKWFLGLVACVGVIVALKYASKRGVPASALPGLEKVRAKAHSLVDRSLNKATALARTVTGVPNWSEVRERAKLLGAKGLSAVYQIERAQQGVFGGERWQALKDWFSPVVFRFMRANPWWAIRLLLLQPLAEEAFKRHIGARQGSVILSSLDILGNLELFFHKKDFYGGVARASEAWLANLAIHIVCAKLSLGQGVALHSSYNIAVLNRQLTHVGLPASKLSFAKDSVLPLASTLVGAMAGLMTTGVKLIDEFDQYWYDDRETAFTADPTICLTQMKDQHFFVPGLDSVNATLPAQDPTIKVTLPHVFPDESQGTGGYYRIYGVNTFMGKPRKSATNAKYLVTHRLCREIPHRMNSAYVLPIFNVWNDRTLKPHFGELWKQYDRPVLTGEVCDSLIGDLVLLRKLGTHYAHSSKYLDFGEKYKAWEVHTDPAKRSRYRACFARLGDDPLSVESKIVKGVQVNIKCDEVLLKPDWVPRPIDAVDPLLAVDIGVEIYDASCAIKKIQWFDEVGEINHPDQGQGDELMPFTLTYGAGRTASELSKWFNKAIATSGFHVIVAGDDSLVVKTYRNQPPLIIETDVSQNDHSIRLPMLRLEWLMLRQAGCSEDCIRKLEKNAKAPRVVTFRDSTLGQAIIHREAERNTGGTDTTVGNTIASQAAWTLVASKMANWLRSSPGYPREGDWEVMIAAGFAACGLAVKSKIFGNNGGELGREYYPGSFLKGTWWWSEDGTWVWSVLPSRFIKTSKMINDPRRIYRLKGEPKIGYKEAAERHMIALAKSLLPFGLPRGLRTWLESFLVHPVTTRIQPLREDVVAEWKPKGDTPIAFGDDYTSQMSNWYKLDEEMVLSWAAMLSGVKPLDFMFHPVWEVMAQRDYC